MSDRRTAIGPPATGPVAGRSLRTRLLWLGLLPLLVVFPLVLGLLVAVGGSLYDARVQATARSHLATAHSHLYQQQVQLEKYIQQMVQTSRLQAVLADPDQMGLLGEVLAARADAARLDFLVVSDESGRVVAASPSLAPATALPMGYVLSQAITGVLTSGYERLDAEAIATVLPTLRRGADEESATASPAHLLTTGGLVVSAAAHFPYSNRYPNAVLYGGVLLDGNAGVIERVRDVVFPVGRGTGDTGGVAAILAGDRQVATTLGAADGRQAIGTRAPPEVVESVLVRGERLIGTSELLGIPYITSYEPIVGARGEPLGMLLAAIPEAPIRHEKWLLIGSVTALLAVAMLALTMAFRRGTGDVVRRLGSTMQSMRAAQSGDRAVRVPVGRAADEIDQLGAHFNALIETVAHQESERERDLREKSALNAELEHHRNHLEEMVARRTAELARARDEAESASKAKSRFLANVSHEIRTPMNAISGFAQLLRRQITEPRQAKRVDAIIQATMHLLGIVNDILDFSAIEADRVSLESIQFDVPSLLDNVRRIVEAPARDKGLALEIEIDPELVGATLVGDSLRLGQILINLCTNAVKFTEHGGVHVKAASVDADAGSVVVQFDVADTGIGIAADAQDRIFEAFEQAETSATRHHGGTGLGLAISRRLVELMGGQLGVESEPGRGSTFWCRLELRRGRPADGDHVGAAPAARGLPRGARILLVEDNDVSQTVALETLESIGVRADLARNGSEALAMIGSARYDLVLMDLQMPVMNGIEATRRIRALDEGRTVPIVAVTANAFETDRELAREAGMNDFLAKPIDSARLQTTLAHWLEAS
ncbi:MAG: response regulator [Ectothiorhodospiraceae bacterium]|nr:response regulator [Ectothiorhodospiraceae bacterium]